MHLITSSISTFQMNIEHFPPFVIRNSLFLVRHHLFLASPAEVLTKAGSIFPTSPAPLP